MNETKHTCNDLLLNFLLFIFSFIIPKNKNLFVVGAREGNFFAENSKHVYLYANRIEGDDRFIWITKKESVLNMLKIKNLPVVYMYSIKGFLSILRANKLILSSSQNDVSYFRIMPGRFRSIQLWHGSPIKDFPFASKGKTLAGKLNTIFLKMQYSHYEFVLHTCEKTKWVFEKCFLTKKIKVLGYPRNDCLFNPTDFEQLPNLEQYKKVILYMPTFRDTKSSIRPFSKKGLTSLNRFLKKNSFILLVRKHFAERFWKIETSYSNILDVSEVGDAQELMANADVLISDYSGASLDYCLLNRPIIFYPYDYKEYSTESREIILNYFKDLPGPFAHNEEELLELLKKSPQRPKQKEYQEFIDSFNKFKDAGSSKRVYEEIIL